MPEPQVLERVDHYWAILHKRRGLLAASMAGALLLAAGHNLTARPQYEAVAQLLIDLGAPDVLSLPELAEGGKGARGDRETQYELLRSRTLAEKALAALGSRLDAELGPGRGVEAFRSRVSVEPVSTTRLVNLRFRAYDPELAAQTVNLLARLYVEQWLEFRWAGSREASAWLAEKARDERRRLVVAEEVVQSYRERYGLLGPAAGEGEEADPVLAGLTAALVRARIERVAREAFYREMEGQSPTELEVFPKVASSAPVQGLKAERARAYDEEATLAETLGDRHPQMVGLRARIAALEEHLQAETLGVVLAAKAEWETAAARERRLAGELRAARRGAEARTARAVRLRSLQQEVEIRRQLFKELRRRSLETGLASQLRVGNLRIVETAEVPRSPILPRTWRNYRLALVLGSALGIALCVLRERLDPSVRTPDDVAELGLPFLGFVPRVTAERTLLALEPHAAAAEAYRVVRTNLIFSSADGGSRVILVSSSSPGEGKTTTAANLAASLAQNGSRVLALDADLRRPRLHDHFGFAAAPGLSEVLGDRCRVAKAIQATPVRGLKVLASGETPVNPAELLASNGFRRLLAAQRRRYHWIVIDAPPLLALADAPSLCPLVDGLVLVVWAESTSRPAVQRAVEQVARVGGKVSGVVLNKVDLEGNAYYYSQHYGDYYYNYYINPDPARAPA